MADDNVVRLPRPPAPRTATIVRLPRPYLASAVGTAAATSHAIARQGPYYPPQVPDSRYFGYIQSLENDIPAKRRAR